MIARARRSPYQVTFGDFSSRVPNRTGISRPSSAVGAWKSSRLAGLAFCGFGVSTSCSANDASPMMMFQNMAQTMLIENGFSSGMKGKLPLFSMLSKRSLQRGTERSQPG
ncbi:hypothetical protein D8676_25380 [Mesorhizobium sp. YM1C-6-2]|nr:hypothetical protein D8676_25380 [Mesorhizobium sp. YM1C-6-2]